MKVASQLASKLFRHDGPFYSTTSRSAATDDYYAVLQVPTGATKHDIKKQFYRLSLLYHPDRHHVVADAEAKMKFHQISEAYSVLSDTQKRKAYDSARATCREASSVRESSQRSPFAHGAPGFRATRDASSEMFGRHPHRPYVFYNAREHFMGHYGRSLSRKRREEVWRRYMSRGETESKDAMISLIKLVSWLAVPVIYILFRLGS